MEKNAQVFGINILAFIQSTEKDIYFMMNSSVDNNTICYGSNQSLAIENEYLKKLLESQESLLVQQKSEITTVKQMIELLRQALEQKI